MVDRHKPLECLSSPLLETLPTQCQQLQKGLRDCKRGMVDMRKRFRGNAPISNSLELEGGGQKGGQLYGGKPVFEGVKERSGYEPENQMDPEKTRGL